MNPTRWQIPPWTWSFGFAAIVLILVMTVSGRGGATTVSFALSLAPYLVLVGIGQMLVISAGPGNIDVSVAQVFALAGFVSIAASEATGSWVVSLIVAMATGIGISLISVVGITFLKIPPIVATLAAGLIASAVTLTINKAFEGSAAPELKGFLNWAPFGVPALAIVVAVFTVFVSFALARTVWGRHLLAVGQARRSADYAGLHSSWIVASVYLISGALAGLAGALLAAYIAPTVDLGSNYLLDSIAVVIIGGTLISGGRAVPAGVWGGALFFILLDGLLNLIGWNFAGQNVLKGLLVLAVLFLAGGLPILRRRQASRVVEDERSPSSTS